MNTIYPTVIPVKYSLHTHGTLLLKIFNADVRSTLLYSKMCKFYALIVCTVCSLALLNSVQSLMRWMVE